VYIPNNVGIGTASPASKLHIRNDSAADQLRLGRVDDDSYLSVGAGANNAVYNMVTGGTIAHQFQEDGDAKMTILTNGNVGIGTTSPSVKLHVNDNDVLIGNNNNGYATLNFHNEGTGSGRYASIMKNYDSPYDMRIRASNSTSEMPLVFDGSNDTEYARFDTSGRFGIGTTSPLEKLHIYEIGNSAYKTYASAGAGVLITSYQSQGNPYTKTTDIVANSDGTVPSEMRLFTKASGASSATERMRITPAGSVGIGTTSPQKQLDITSTNVATQQLKGSGTGDYAGSQFSMFAGTTSNVFNSVMFAMDRRTDGVGGIYLQRRDSSHAYKGTLFRYLDTDGWIFGTASSTTATSTGDHFTITPAGNVGIGTMSPGAKLDVGGDADEFAFIGRARVGFNSHSDWASFQHRDSATSTGFALLQNSSGRTILNSASGQQLQFRVNNADGTQMIFDGSQLGIGNVSPQSILHLGTGNTARHIKVSDNRAMFGYDGANAVVQGGNTKGIEFNTGSDTFNANTRMTITSAGNVGIGTESPTSLLTTSGGDIRILGSGNRLRFNTNGSIYWDSSVGVKLENASTENITIETNTSGDIYLNTANTRTMTITDDKEVFVGSNVQNQNLAFGGTLKTHQYLDTRDYMQHKGHFAESDWIVMESGDNHVVTSYFDNTNVYVDGVYKGKIDSAFGQATISSADLSLGSVISADRAVVVHQSGTIRSMCMSTRFSGKLLGTATTRGYPITIHIYAPYTSVSYSIYRSSSANVDLSATALTTGTISQGGIITFTESDTTSGTQYYVIEADGKVCATLDAVASDHLLFTPLAMEVIASSFSRENRGGVTTGIAEDSTNISETQNGTHAFYLKDTSGKYGLFATGVADGAGSEAEFAMPIEFCSDYYIYGDTDLSNYRLVCFQDTFVKVLDVSGNVLYTHDGSSATKNAPLYFDNGTATGAGTLSTAGPFRFVGTAPFYLVCQEPGNQDEATMLGAMQHELSNNQRFKGGYVPNATTIDANLVVNDSNFTLLADSTNNRVNIGTNATGWDGDADNLVIGTGSGNNGMTIYAGSTSFSQINFADSNVGNGRYTGVIRYNHNTNDMSFHTDDGVVAMTIDDSQNVGIGVTSPSSKFHVSGGDSRHSGGKLIYEAGGDSDYFRIQRASSSGRAQMQFTNESTSELWRVGLTGGGGEDFVFWNGSNNVLILDRSANEVEVSGKLLVGSTSSRSSVAGYSPKLNIEGAGASGYVQIVDTENGQFHGGSLALHKYRSGGIVANTELGSIWFGGTDSANSTFAQGALIRAYAEGADSGSNVATNVRFFTNTGSAVTEAMRIESDQDVHFDQDVIAFSTTPSDKRLKKNIKDIDYGLDAVMKLSPKEYDWKKDDRHDIGFIAQEVEKVIPEIVKDKKHFDKQIKTLDYEKLTAVLIKAVQEQQQQINKLEEKLNG
jgi:hypothetical protein